MLKVFIDDMLMPRLDWLQVEVTSSCNASCLYCPRPAMGNKWRNRHLDPALFKKLLPALKHTALAYLQGWGEPLLHPDFFDLVSMAKKSGCRVGTTTNGILVDAEMSRRIAASGLDVISFSLAGTGRRNDFWRRGTSLDGVVRAIGHLAEAREKSGSSGPEIHVSYLALRSNLEDLERLPKLLEGTAVSEVIVSTLDFIPGAGLGAEAFPPADRDGRATLRSLLREVSAEGEKRGLFVHYRLPGDKILGSPCSENPLRSAFISSDGSVSACVINGLPAEPMDARRGTDSMPYDPIIFGSLAEDSFSAIWRRKTYRTFRRKLEAGRPEPPCSGCLKLSAKYWTRFPYY